MNMPCSSLNELVEVTCKVFTPLAAETIQFSPMLEFCNVFDHLALRGTLRYFEPDHARFTEGLNTDEVTAYVETMMNIARTVRSKKTTTRAVFVSPPDMIYVSAKIHAAVPVLGAGGGVCEGS